MMSSVLRKTKRRSAICKVIERSFCKADTALAQTSEDPTQITSVLAYRDTIVEKFQTVKALDEEILNDLVDKDTDILDMEVDLSTEFSVFYRQRIIKLNNFLHRKGDSRIVMSSYQVILDFFRNCHKLRVIQFFGYF